MCCLQIEQNYFILLENRTMEVRFVVKKFAKKEMAAKLKDWYEQKSKSRLRRKLLKKKQAGTVFDIQPEISSVESVEVFLEVEPLIKFELQRKGTLIKPGGYRSCEEFVKDLLPKLENRFNQFYKIAKSIPPLRRGITANVN